MWSSVLALALLVALNPVRLGITLLVISRPRPMQNLLAYWVGSLIVVVPYMLVPLMVLHFTPRLASFAQDLATPATVAGSTVRHIQIGMGVLTLLVAALMTVCLFARQQAQLPIPGATTSTLVLDSKTPPTMSALLGRAQDMPTEGESAIRQLLGRTHNAWQNGSVWVSLVIGLWWAPIDAVLFVLAIIVTSGAAIGTQVSAAIAFVVGMLAVVEVILVSYVVTPAKTEAVLRLLHDWARAQRRKVLVATFAVVGVMLVAQGMGTV